MKLWKIAEGATSETSFQGDFQAGCYDPHHSNLFVAAQDNKISTYDLRTKSYFLIFGMYFLHSCTLSIDAHSHPILSIDYNPNKLYSIVTASQDRRIKFWDLRKPSLPLKILTGHTHWVSAVRYNRFHDQLIVSGGCDAQVNLWSVTSISSAPVGDLEDHHTETLKDGDKLIKSFDENEDSVYSLAWSACDAWIWASLSYDGRVVVRHVPSQEKYKILL